MAERWQVSVDEAFARLRGHARPRQLRLTDLARRVIAGDIDAEAIWRNTETDPASH
ncbi:hypothetical protein [Streptomyces sp. NBC_01262]|uniref:hypothetical protein n=1 Tax=Streptomyces sp. NBC_01262 TaxID=2903803 RepID=UPI002E3368D2|nr:hypothetical protein [Streptomyces sp. NBC_01262]